MAGIETIARRYATAADESRHEFDDDRVETERDLLVALQEELGPDDTVWILGTDGGPYAMLAADVVGPDQVAVVNDELSRRRKVADLLSRAALDEVSVAAPDARADRPASPTVVVVDGHASEPPAVTTALAGRLPGVRYLLVKSDDEATADRLRQGGFETTRIGGDDSSTPWETVVAGRRDPSATVNPVVSRLFDGAPAVETPDDRDQESGEDENEEPDGPLALAVGAVQIVLGVVVSLLLAVVSGVMGSVFVLLITAVLWPLWLLPGPEAWLMRNDLLLYGVGFVGGFCSYFLGAGGGEE